jgi:AraC-like DNA-binding protein
MQLENPNFVNLLHLLAQDFKAKVTDYQFEVNPQFGKGYYWAEKLPSEITVLVCDTCLRESLTIERPEWDDYCFTLEFNEEAADEEDIPLKAKRKTAEYESFVKLSYTLTPGTFVFPATKRLRSVKFFFNKQHLLMLLGAQATEELLSHYFPTILKSENLEPIATEYRVLLDELWTNRINQPLRLNFIQNRILLLLETYILKLVSRQDPNGKRNRRSEDEKLRLMKVEALLVKNFAVPPPTIDELSRISAMSATKLKNDFKAVYGHPIYQYFQKNRMRKAKALLEKSEFTIKEVGIMVGYSNLSHFANSFKKEFGYLPSKNASQDGFLVYS